MIGERFWSTCPACGKERQIHDLGVPEYRALAERFSCRACEMDTLIKINSCPERVQTEDADETSCGLAWHHEGRCVPIVTNADRHEAIRRLKT